MQLFVRLLLLVGVASLVGVVNLVGAVQQGAARGEDIQIETKLGSVKGTRQILNRTRLMGEIVSHKIDTFINVPYAQPPVGQLRFKYTAPLRPWQHSMVLDARLGQSPIYCVGYFSMTPITQPNYRIQEDCLYLAIYSPYQSERPLAKYPVMVYIHGGSYYVGSGNDYDGSLLAARGVVVVTINYRLADLGLLSSGDSRLPGNYGIMDQVEALRWVKQYIAAFRGDDSRITIFGASAGAASVGWMLMSPLTEGLFHGAILQSGGPLSFWALYRPEYCNQKEYYKKYLSTVGCHYPTHQQVMHCLHGKTAQQLTPDYDSETEECVRSMRQMPRVDGYVIPMSPEKAFRTGKFHKVPVIIGCTREEIAFMVGAYIHPHEVRSSNVSKLARYVFSEMAPHMKSAAESIAFEYTLWDENLTVEKTWRETEAFLTDWIMLAPAMRLAEYITDAGGESYFYMFMHSHVAHDIPEQLAHRQMIDDGSVLNTSLSYHGFELNFVWGADEERVINTSFIIKNEIHEHGYQYTKADRKVANAVMTWWTNFAKYGTPSRPNDGLNVTWTPFNKYTGDYLHISDNPSMGQRYRQHKVLFWNHYIIPLLEQKQPAVKSSLSSGGKLEYGDIVIPRWTLTLLCALLAGCVIILVVVFIKVVKAKPKPKPPSEEPGKEEVSKMI